MADVSTQELVERPAVLKTSQQAKSWVNNLIQQEQQQKHPRSLLEIAELLAVRADMTEELVELLNRVPKPSDLESQQWIDQKIAFVERSVEATNRNIDYSTKHQFKPINKIDYLLKLSGYVPQTNR